MSYRKAINLDLLRTSTLSLANIFPSILCYKLVPDLQFAISNTVYKQYKVRQTQALMESGCFFAQSAVLFCFQGHSGTLATFNMKTVVLILVNASTLLHLALSL